MLQLLRIYDPDITLVLLPYFIESNRTKIEVGRELNDRMREKPEETLVLITTDNQRIYGYLTAYKREDDIFIWQLWQPTYVILANLYLQEQFWEILQNWTLSQGVDKISMIPTSEKLRKYFKKYYGFEDSTEGEMIWERNHPKAVAISKVNLLPANRQNGWARHWKCMARQWGKVRKYIRATLLRL